MLQSGLHSLFSYLAAHVLLCLVPAFFIAGAMTALIPKESIARYLGKNSPKWISYPIATVGGFILAVCSCTIMPLFASIYKKGAGLGQAITFLFVGPAINILAIAYTGAIIGMDIALARIILSSLFGIIIGLIMAFTFYKDKTHKKANVKRDLFASKAKIKPINLVFISLLILGLIIGTLRIDLLKNTFAKVILPITNIDVLQTTVYRLLPNDISQGQEDISLHGILIIIMLILIGMTALLGLNEIYEGFNSWSWVSILLICLTILIATFEITPKFNGLDIGLTGRFIGEFAIIITLGIIAWKTLKPVEVKEWLWEMWHFVKQIFPLLIIGVFIAGMLKVLIPPLIIKNIAGRNSILANLVGVLFGVFMYFPTLVEVPIASMFLELGMHRGPLLAYLIADPALSIQSILITAKVIGFKKTFVYVFWVTIFSTLAGLIFGFFIR
jgi:hypothetical protein